MDMNTTDSSSAVAQRPFIIWTLQRTGGTNLTNRLILRAKFPRPEHEPFNRRREFGRVTQNWDVHGDRTRLTSDLAEICSEEPCIKHCVEQVPWAVSEELARVSMRRDYHHLFLYRRNALQRLLSVEYARRTGAWGRGKAKRVREDEKAFEEPLDVGAIISHERRCNRLLQSAWDLLVGAGANPKRVAYEDIYETDEETAAENLLTILRDLGLSRGVKSDQKFIEKIRNSGQQGTRNRYSRFEGISELSNALEGVDQFDPHAGIRNRPGLIRRLAGFGRRAIRLGK